MKSNIDKEIRRLTIELQGIEQLKETAKTMGWQQIIVIFNRVIGGYLQEVYDLCSKYGKHEFEIKVKKGIADALSKILAEVDGRVKREGFVRDQIKKKNDDKEKAVNGQESQTL